MRLERLHTAGFLFLYDILETANLQRTEVGEFSIPQVLLEIMKGQGKPWSGLSVI